MKTLASVIADPPIIEPWINPIIYDVGDSPPHPLSTLHIICCIFEITEELIFVWIADRARKYLPPPPHFFFFFFFIVLTNHCMLCMQLQNEMMEVLKEEEQSLLSL